jgi:two-component system chemotaxis response regulator CheB
VRPRVLVADDSPYVRASITASLKTQGFDVVGQARNGEEAIAKNLELEPDVVLLDLQMPVVDGVEATRRILETRPVPILVFASMDAVGTRLAIQALAEGAYDVVAKGNRFETSVDLAPRIWAIATRQEAPARPSRVRMGGVPDLVVVASSTGGPPCVEALVRSLPSGFPAPVVVAQHMPPGFTRSLALRLDGLSASDVFEAEEGARVGPGQVAILPGGAVSTLEAADRPSTFALHVGPGDSLPGAKPSASALFFSALGAAQGNVLGIVLTGMGADGSDAVRALVSAGATIIAQDPAEAVIPSMPNAALVAGAQRRMRVREMVEHLRRLAPAKEVP